jgi:hypothetical protein
MKLQRIFIIQCPDQKRLTVASYSKHLLENLDTALSQTETFQEIAILSSLDPYAISIATHVAAKLDISFSAHSVFWSKEKRKQPWIDDDTIDHLGISNLVMSYSDICDTLIISMNYRHSLDLLKAIVKHLYWVTFETEDAIDVDENDHDSVLKLVIGDSGASISSLKV